VLLTGGKSDEPPVTAEGDTLSPAVESDQISDTFASTAAPSAVQAGSDQAVRNYYQLVNERRYEEAWPTLSSYFQAHFSNNSYQDYVTWWNKVEYVEVGQVTVVPHSDIEAVVTAELWYHMKDGRIIKDEHPNIRLGYDTTAGRWLFQDKW
jgi:serine/threonine-protein kinase